MMGIKHELLRGVLKMPVDMDHFPVSIQTVPHLKPNVDMYLPQVVGMHNQAAEHAINHAIIQQFNELIDEQRQVQVQGQTEMSGYYEIKTNERGVLSLIQVNYAITPQMAHGMTFARSLTFDVRTGKSYALSELFKPGSPYVQAISEQVSQQIKERDISLLNEFKGIRPDQDFYIADKALVIYFQLYEITPYYYGFPMFPISIYSLQNIIEERSPLGLMLADI